MDDSRSKKGNKDDFRVIEDRLPHRLLRYLNARSHLHINSRHSHGETKINPSECNSRRMILHKKIWGNNSNTGKEGQQVPFYLIFQPQRHPRSKETTEKKVNVYPGLDSASRDEWSHPREKSKTWRQKQLRRLCTKPYMDMCRLRTPRWAKYRDRVDPLG